MFCSKCGFEVQNDAAFCSACGAKVGQPPTQQAPPPPQGPSHQGVSGENQAYTSPSRRRVVEFGRYPQITSTDETPISWLVLKHDPDTMEATLISKSVLDCAKYNGKKREVTWDKKDLRQWVRKVVTDVIPDDVTWQDSEIRQWLNNDFYNKAFNQEEKEKIIIAQNAGNGVDCIDDLPQTEDHVFLLNSDEARLMGGDHQRLGAGTEFAKKTKSDGCCLYTYGGDGSARWWLRNRGTGGVGTAAYVNDNGSVYTHGHDAHEMHYGVRPAIRVKLDLED